MQYGQQTYDFDDGLMLFVAPNQIIRGAGTGPDEKLSGWMLLIHPDLLWNSLLATKISRYEFFDYAVNEALFLSEKEEAVVTGIVKNMQQECRSNLDRFSKQIIVSHLENLLSYAERFYHRQFITREKGAHQILDRLNNLLSDYLDSDDLKKGGLPTVKYVSEQLHISPTYLRGLLKELTGKSTQQHIHDRLIERAKEKLSTTNLSVSEIAYELGFEHLQSFSKLFKTKAKFSPLQFRQSFT